jgi:hypothetical protein
MIRMPDTIHFEDVPDAVGDPDDYAPLPPPVRRTLEDRLAAFLDRLEREPGHPYRRVFEALGAANKARARRGLPPMDGEGRILPADTPVLADWYPKHGKTYGSQH